ncbi:MAG: hemerythrin domain-containing protein [Gammaproteobacteria bacterium]|nr:hemerythrin domain-containing protein [Gammaproteobacteria bacterium]
MEPTEILKEEHRVIERVLAALETAASRLKSGEAISPAIFLQAVEFIIGFADGCHHKKEEGVLFPAMQATGIPSEGGPIGVLIAEHQEGRRLTGAMRVTAEKLQAGDIRARDELARSALLYVDLLRQHIAKEDGVLFPMAERVIKGPAKAEVSEAFEHIEHEETGQGVHERFLALADAIEQGAEA